MDVDADFVKYPVHIINVPESFSFNEIKEASGKGDCIDDLEIESSRSLLETGTVYKANVAAYQDFIELCSSPKRFQGAFIQFLPHESLRNPFNNDNEKLISLEAKARLENSKSTVSRNRLLCVGPFADVSIVSHKHLCEFFGKYTTVQSIVLDKTTRLGYIRLKAAVANQVLGVILKQDSSASSTKQGTGTLVLDGEKVNIGVVAGFQERLWWDLTAAMTKAYTLGVYYKTEVTSHAVLKRSPQKKRSIAFKHRSTKAKAFNLRSTRNKKVLKKAKSIDKISDALSSLMVKNKESV